MRAGFSIQIRRALQAIIGSSYSAGFCLTRSARAAPHPVGLRSRSAINGVWFLPGKPLPVGGELHSVRCRPEAAGAALHCDRVFLYYFQSMCKTFQTLHSVSLKRSILCLRASTMRSSLDFSSSLSMLREEWYALRVLPIGRPTDFSRLAQRYQPTCPRKTYHRGAGSPP